MELIKDLMKLLARADNRQRIFDTLLDDLFNN